MSQTHKKAEVGVGKDRVYLVTDTSWWMDCGYRDGVRLVEKFSDLFFVIPAGVMRELDGLKRNPEKGRKALEATKRIENLVRMERARIITRNGAYFNSLSSKVDEEVVGVAKGLRDRGRRVYLLSLDAAQKALAQNLGIKAYEQIVITYRIGNFFWDFFLLLFFSIVIFYFLKEDIANFFHEDIKYFFSFFVLFYKHIEESLFTDILLTFVAVFPGIVIFFITIVGFSIVSRLNAGFSFLGRIMKGRIIKSRYEFRHSSKCIKRSKKDKKKEGAWIEYTGDPDIDEARYGVSI